MFKISPVQDSLTAKKYMSAVNITEKEGAFVYAMTDLASGELMGISQFEIGTDSGYIYDIKEAGEKNDFEAMFILGRQTMNFIEQCGIRYCRAAKDAAEEKLIKAIGFSEQNGELLCDMQGMFDGKCSGHKVELN